jgi:hypothetical protein
LLLWAEDRRKIYETYKAQQKLSRKRKHGETENLEDTMETTVSDLSNMRDSTAGDSSMDESSAEPTNEHHHSPPVEDQRRKDDPVLKTIQTIFIRFVKETRASLLRPTVTFIVFFLNELAKAPRTEQWHRLMEFVDRDLLVFVLGRLEPSGMSLSVFLSLYDISKEENRISCLKYACMLRKIGAV